MSAHGAQPTESKIATTPSKKDPLIEVCSEHDRKLTPYEMKRQERIKRNNERLAQFGLLSRVELIKKKQRGPYKRKNFDHSPKRKSIPRKTKIITNVDVGSKNRKHLK